MSAQVTPYPTVAVGDVVRCRGRPDWPEMLVRQFERDRRVALLQLPRAAALLNIDSLEDVIAGVAYTYAPVFCLTVVPADYFVRQGFAGDKL